MEHARVATTRGQFRGRAREAGPGARVPVRATVRADPFAAYRRTRGDAPSFLLETGGGREGWSYFGVEPDRFVEVGGDGALDALGDCLAGEALVRGDCEVPYPGGWFGWLSYDAVRKIETLPDETVDDRGLPRLQLGRYPCVAAWREPHDGETTVHVVASPKVSDDPDDPNASNDPDAAYDRGLELVADLADAAVAGDPAVGPPPVHAEAVEFTSRCDEVAYADRVRRVQERVRAGDTFQANVSHRLTAPAAVHPVEAFAALRRVNPAPYSGLLEFPGVDLVSASPELLLARDGDRLETEPIAGTRPRGDSPEADRELEAELRADGKERAEHAMLVDLERNDLGKVSEYGSVSVEEYRRVDRYSAVMHLVSRVSGRLRPDCGLADAVAAVFPGGTITGAPKPRTMELIEAVEERRRGPYTGSVAAVGFDGRATLNILIRTLVRHGDAYHLRVGGGVVADSVPAREYAETLAKARGLVNAVDAALGDGVAMEVAGR